MFLDIKDLNFLKDKSSFELLEKIIAKKGKILICDSQDPRSEKVNEISKLLIKIQRNQKSIEEETGKKEFFLGYPFLEGKTLDGTLLRSPLLFFPLDLMQENNTWVLKSRPDEIQFNLSLITALSHNKASKLEALDELGLNEHTGNSLVFRTKLYELIKENELAIDFNSDIFSNDLAYFLKTSKLDFEQNSALGELKLYPKAVLGLFPQGGSFLINDYQELIAKASSDFNIEEIFASQTLKTEVKEENLILPFETDGSQEAAIIKIKSGQSINIQGPPGTGKSQLICNLVSDFIANNKKVLVVCQKRAALDTIYERFSFLNFNRNLALVHDFKADRRSILNKIVELIEQIPEIEQANKSLDAVFIEREFYQTARSIEQICRELDAFKNALFDDSMCQTSIKELYLSRNKQLVTVDLNTLFLEFKFKEIYEFKRKLAELETYDTKTGILIQESVFFAERKSFKDLQNSDLSEIQAALNGLMLVIQEDQFKSICLKEANVLNIYAFKDEYDFFQNSELSEFNRYNQISQTFAALEIEKDIDFLKKNKLRFSELFEMQIPNENQLKEAYIASKSFFRILLYKFSASFKNNIQPTLSSLDLEFNTVSIGQLQSELGKLDKWKKYISKYKNVVKFSTELDFISELEKYCKFLNFKESTPRSIFTFVLADTSSSKSNISSLTSWLTKLQENLKKLNLYFSFKNISCINHQQLADLAVYFEIHFFDIQQKDSLLLSLQHSELKVYNLVKSSPDYIDTFEQSLIHHWIAHIEDKNPILKAASSSRLKILEEQLSDLTSKKRALSLQIIQLRLGERISSNLEKNRLGNVVTYRDLLHQASKKRGLWPLRKIIKQFEEEVFKLLPCWLVSPETSSAIFSAELASKFDIVIFDEASQCFPEEGIPSILKANQLVIVGDKMQLQPNALYKTRFEDHTIIDEPLLEVESLVQLAERYLTSTILNHHYRSKYPSLISFSNSNFYKNKLKTLPDYKDIGEKAIEVVKVNGVWNNQTNNVEADRVVEILKTIPENTKVGVVTFNYRQSELIFDQAELAGVISPNVSIKNIENIQGDEFDIVIFSIGYAPDLDGIFRLSFGTLNQKGGENRLNVAVSRAREKIIIVTSISSIALKVEGTLNAGPKLLKAYLENAENLEKNENLVFEPEEPSSNSLKRVIKENENIQYCNYNLADLEFEDNLICTDDKLYFESESAKEYFVYKPNEMKRKNWQVLRRWSRENL